MTFSIRLIRNLAFWGRAYIRGCLGGVMIGAQAETKARPPHNTMKDKRFTYSWLGLVDFAPALEIQKQTVKKRQENEIDDTIFFLEHPPVYTLGKRGNKSGLLISEEELSERNVQLVQTDRGGDITFHGPGQLVVYPIIKLAGHYQGVREYVRLLEQTVMGTLKNFGGSGRSDPKYPGVWVGEKKIAAVGVRIQRGVAYHGISLNININHDYFKWILPCGIKNCEVTSIHECCGKKPDMKEVLKELVNSFAVVFKYAPVNID